MMTEAAAKAFGFAVLIDMVWAVCVSAVSQRQAVRAAICSGLLTWLGSCVVRLYVGDPRLIWPAVAGAVIGTFAVVRFGRYL